MCGWDRRRDAGVGLSWRVCSSTHHLLRGGKSRQRDCAREREESPPLPLVGGSITKGGRANGQH